MSTSTQLGLKRLTDLAIAVPGLILLLPLLAWIAWRVRRDVGSPVLFRQERPGLQGRPFQILKFRTMTNLREEHGTFASDEDRLTRFGRWLRATSLDELPELANVVRGDMSLIGPRPLLMEYLPLYTSEQRRRHAVPPGITGWAQINGRNATTWEERFALDVWYVDNWSLKLDVNILLKTGRSVLLRDGISAEGHVTMPPFRGSGQEGGKV